MADEEALFPGHFDMASVPTDVSSDWQMMTNPLTKMTKFCSETMAKCVRLSDEQMTSIMRSLFEAQAHLEVDEKQQIAMQTMNKNVRKPLRPF